MIQEILQYGFAAVAVLCLLGAWLSRPQRAPFAWAFISAVIAAISAHLSVAWPIGVFGLMVIWALFVALPIMNSTWRLKAGLTIYLIAFAALSIYPTYHDELIGKIDESHLPPEQRADNQIKALRGELGLKRYLLANIPFRMVRGLDLKGGLRLVYTVDVEEAIKDKRDRYYEDLRGNLTKLFKDVTGYGGDDEPTVDQRQKLNQILKLSKPREEADTIILAFNDEAQAAQLDAEFLRPFRFELSVLRSADRKTLTFRLLNEIESNIRGEAVTQAKQTVHRRVDSMGLKEASVSVRDEDIIIEVPGDEEEKFQEIRDIISQTARLEFKMLHDEVDFFEEISKTATTEQLPKGLSFSIENAPIGPGKSKPSHYARLEKLDGETMQEALGRFQEWIKTLEVGQDHEIGFGKFYEFSEDTGENEAAGWRSYYLWSKADVTGDMVRFAQARPEQANQSLGGWVVALEFTPIGAQRFEEVTGANIKKRFAIILDEKVESAPVIQARIAGGHAQITMGAGSVQQQLKDARKLELVLRSGALPAPITKSYDQRIGPSLGADSIGQGLKAAAIGGIAVLLLMFVSYRKPGAIANFAVLLNLGFQLAVLSMFSASLTLPGIAGLALTVGIAVDANVLINERIKEELAAGKTARSAVSTGYDKAFSAIIDGNITTLISALILAQYGTGPIKGFAVTLIVGIVCNLFTGVLVTRLFFEFWVRGRRTTKLGLG